MCGVGNLTRAAYATAYVRSIRKRLIFSNKARYDWMRYVCQYTRGASLSIKLYYGLLAVPQV